MLRTMEKTRLQVKEVSLRYRIVSIYRLMEMKTEGENKGVRAAVVPREFPFFKAINSLYVLQ